MIESILFRPGDEVIHVKDESLDVLTIMEVKERDIICFEYNPNDCFTVSLSDIEPLWPKDQVA